MSSFNSPQVGPVPLSALEKAIGCTAGSPTAFARIIGVSPQRLFNWMRRGVPVKQVPLIVKACRGVLSAHELRPDLLEVFPAPISSVDSQRN